VISRRADNGTPKRQRSVLRRFVETLVIVGIVVGLDVLLVYALFPYGSTSEVVWSEYAAAANQDIDTVIVGSSTGQRCVDPNVLDSALGTSTFSLATPAQPIENTCLAVSEAISSHHVHRVIMGVDYETMSLDPWDKGTVTFVQAMAAHESLPKAMGDYAWLLTTPGFPSTTKFLEVLFPWTLAHVKGGVGSIADNVRMRLDGTTTIEAAEVRDSAWTYVGKGYGNYSYQLDTSKAREAMSPTKHGIADFTDANMATLQKIIDLCRENDVQLVVVATPRPAFNVLCYGEKYPEQMSRMRDAVESGGGVYLDANLLKASYYAPAAEDFADGEHLNATGAEGFSAKLADYLGRLDAGEDVSGLSYSYDDWSEYLASIGYISAVTLDGSVEDGMATLCATPYTGTNVQVEYQFCLCDAGGNVTGVLRDWSSDATVTCAVPADGSLTVRVNTRQVGSSADFERYCVWSSAH
jgi:hypothetical protein